MTKMQNSLSKTQLLKDSKEETMLSLASLVLARLISL